MKEEVDMVPRKGKEVEKSQSQIPKNPHKNPL
jgi:hypothetical protein